jgi:hypothetical protein
MLMKSAVVLMFEDDSGLTSNLTSSKYPLITILPLVTAAYFNVLETSVVAHSKTVAV